MKNLSHLILAVVVVAFPAAALAGDGETTAEAEIGLWGTDVEGVPDNVAEFEPVEGGPLLGVFVHTHQNWGSLLLDAYGTHSNDIQSSLDFDIKRMVRSHTSYDKMLHRLGHDPMTNLEATSINGKVVWHEDRNPLGEYGFDYNVLTHRTELQFPQLKALTIAVDYRDQRREGHKQSYSISHCDNCHIVSEAHPIQEKTEDVVLEANVGWKGGAATVAFASRELRQDYSNRMFTFDDALHPELQVPVFDNRLQYDSAEGALPVDMWPNIDKDTARFDLVLNNVAGFVINGGAVWSETQNGYTGLKSDYSGYLLHAARRLGKAWRLRWRGRVYNISNQDVFVDTNERLSIAGPHAGQTYEDVYGRNFDWVRYSALDRDAFESKLDLSYRVGREAGTFKFEWYYDTIDREYYQVLPGEFQTTTNRLGVTWRARPAKRWKANASLRYAEIENPFMLIDGACSTLESSSYPNPWNPETPQYTEFHDARKAETTASPADWTEFKFNLAYVAGKTTVTGSYRWWDGSNDEGDLTNWSRASQNATITLWSAPRETWDWYLAYALFDTQLDVPICLPVFDG